MKIAISNLNPVVGDIKSNQKKILSLIAQAKAQNAKLICFPELAITGYPPCDLLLRSYFIEEAITAIKEIADQVSQIAVILGGIDQNDQHLYNSLFWLEDRSIKKTYHKILLPTYDVFDEARYFNPGDQIETINYQGLNFGLSICEDIWFDDFDYSPKTYLKNPLTDLKKSQIDYLINISASPYSMEKPFHRYQLLKRVCDENNFGLIYCNQSGANDELIFDGGSMIFNSQQKLIHQSKSFEESLEFVELQEKNHIEYDSDNYLENIFQALKLGIRDYVHKTGFKKVIIGLSGGIDSALTLVLAVSALGSENVLAVMMPSKYSSEGSVNDAMKLIQRLKVKAKLIPIKNIHHSFEQEFQLMFKDLKADLTEENIQARIRGNLLMALANKFRSLVLATSNKSEIAVGYSTLYGDSVGAIAVIGDLYKTLVYQLCHYINQEVEIIPVEIITKAPSAELRENQLDQDSLPAYEILDPIIKAYVEDHLSKDQIIKLGFDEKIVQRILSFIDGNEYKRKQLPLVLRVTEKAFGSGRRFLVTSR